MALTETAPPEIEESTTSAPYGFVRRAEPSGLERVLTTSDHQTIGRLYVGFAVAFLVLDLIVAALVNLQIASDGGVLDALVAARLDMNHLLGLALCGVLPLALGLASVIVPKQIGSPTLSFARAAAWAQWTWLLSAILFGVAVLADGSYGGGNENMARLGNVAVGGMLVALSVGVVCVAVTVLNLRPSGMGLADVPFFSFAMVVTASVWIMTLPSVLASVVRIHIVRPNTTDLATTGFSGVSWLLIQPALYALLLPVLGVIIDSAVVAAGTRLRYRGLFQGLIGVAALLAYGSWAQTDVARNTGVWVVFGLAAVIPILGILGGLGDTLRRDTPSLISPLGFAVAALLVAVLAALTGAMTALDTSGSGSLVGFGTASMNRAQTYLVIGAAVIGLLGGCVLWAQQIFGQQLAEPASKGLVLGATAGAILLGLPHLVLGLVQASDDGVDPRAFAGISAVGGLILALSVLGIAAGGASARRDSRRGDVLVADPWGTGTTLEWIDAVPAEVFSPEPVLDAREAVS